MVNAKLNKKGNFVFNLALVFGILFLTIFILFKFSNMEKSTSTSYIGEIQIKMINYYLEGESNIFSIEQSAKYAQAEALQEFYANGGYVKNYCGESNGYMIWSNPSKKCFLTKEIINQEFTKIYNNSIEKYNKLNIKGNYQINFLNDKILIKGDEIPLKNKDIIYYLKPVIIVDSQYNLDKSYEISELIRINLDKCNQNISCWKSLGNFDIKENNKIIYFDMNLKQNIGYFDKKDIVLKFAIDFNNPIFA